VAGFLSVQDLQFVHPGRANALESGRSKLSTEFCTGGRYLRDPTTDCWSLHFQTCPEVNYSVQGESALDPGLELSVKPGNKPHVAGKQL
jgi:hypothetical protein